MKPPSTTNARTTEPNLPPSHSRLDRLSRLFASQSVLSLVTLLVLLGLAIGLVPVAWTYAHLSLSAPTLTGTKGYSSDGMAIPQCSRVTAAFNSSATFGQISALLQSVDASIAYGPNENGAFEIAVQPGEAPVIAPALLRAAPLVLVASVGKNCP